MNTDTSTVIIRKVRKVKSGLTYTLKLICEPKRSYHQVDCNGFSLLRTDSNGKGLAVATDQFNKLIA